MDRVLGRTAIKEATTSSAVVPVEASFPAWRNSGRDRGQARKKKRSRMVASVIGRMSEAEDDETETEAPPESVFPDDAEEIDGQEATTPQSVKGAGPVKGFKKEPESGDDEELMTPRSALVAPDVTPESEKPLDPSMVPGGETSRYFTADQLEQASSEAPEDIQQPTGSAMDTILARGRGASKPRSSIVPPGSATPPAAGGVSMESAYTMVGAIPPGSNFVEEALLKQGSPMPDHKPADGRKVLESFRRFAG